MTQSGEQSKVSVRRQNMAQNWDIPGPSDSKQEVDPFESLKA